MSKSGEKKSHSAKIESESDLTKNFINLLKLYTDNIDKYSENTSPELEVRFGTRKIKNISKIDFNNVIQILYNYNFTNVSENYVLKILVDDNDVNVRTQINGISNIQNYCKDNNLDNISKSNIEFLNKDYFKYKDNIIYPLNFDDYNFRVSFQIEKQLSETHVKVDELIKKWSTYNKVFRYIKRFEFINKELPIKIHCSIVKISKNSKDGFVSIKNIAESNVFNNIENFEIEIELDNDMVLKNKKFNDHKLLHSLLKQSIKYVLIGLQQSNFPISISQQSTILNKYLKIIKSDDYKFSDKINIKDFIGPSSSTLQIINMLSDSEINETNSSIPNIRHNYTVTDKADGIRKLLLIDNEGKIYLIPMSLNIQFTGCYTENKDIFNTILDGEHILHDRKKQFINTFAVFDIYYLNNMNTTGLPFINLPDTETGENIGKQEDAKNKNNYRLVLLTNVIKNLNPNSVLGKKNIPMKFIAKKFYANNIFNACSTILNNDKMGIYDYETDGLIFTPINTGVANNKTGFNAPNYKTTWNESFKWKPANFNTIDFLVRFKKNQLGNNFIGNIHVSGNNLTSLNQVKQYYTLILHVGFDEKRHGYINPCADIINDNMKKNTQESYRNDYKPVQFYPTNPSDENAGICNILAIQDKSNILKIYTEDGEEIEDNSIVEFRYDINNEHNWRWIPLRNRHDKTYELRTGNKNYGNAYHVANSNWQSIHNPITEEMITKGSITKINLNDDDVYYNKITNVSNTRALRDFHNLYVKSLLINSIASENNSLIDYAVGKGGDLPKWIHANLDFVFGIDVSKDNIENRLDGACARYLNYVNRFNKVPNALFVNGNSSSNIKSGEGIYTEKYKQIVKAIFGEGTKTEAYLGKGVYKNFGKVKNGFNISSIQFAIHYMFENITSLNGFLKNVAECTCLNGYFIGTCYDGSKIFNMLEQIKKGESISHFNGDNKIWQITKQFDNLEFNNDETSLGLAIDIYQETINKTFREYLVNFEYLTRVLENYGFVLLSSDELKSINLQHSIGSFQYLFENMKQEIKSSKYNQKKYGTALNMSEAEKTISFLNKYFIFKKIRNISTDIELSKKSDEIDVDGAIKSIEEDIEVIDKEEIDKKIADMKLENEAIEKSKIHTETKTKKPKTTKPKTDKPKTNKSKIQIKEE